MSNCIFASFKNAISNACEEIFGAKIKDYLPKCTASPPSVKFAGDFHVSANHALILSGILKQKREDIADQIIKAIMQTAIATEISQIEEISGFINIKLTNNIMHKVLQNVLVNENFGFENIGQGEVVNVEFVSANPTGPLHIGHVRGAVYGDVICNLLEKSGYNVIREYYINDAGAQIEKLVQSVLFHAKQIQNNTTDPIPQGLYPGDYLIPIAKAVIQYNPIDLHEFITKAMMDLIRKDLKNLGVRHSVFTSEKQIIQEGWVDKAVAYLKNKDLVYTGKIEKPKSGDTEDWEDREQLLFRSTNFGDDSDRPLQKSNGTWAYFTPDIAYHYNKYTRGANKMILLLGADHKGYKKRIAAAVSAISDAKASVDVKLCELVNFVKNGEVVKMSKRAGNFLTLSEVLEQVDPQILRFFMINKKSDTLIDFDFDKVIEQSKENPIFYIQYAHTRASSVLNNAAKQDMKPSTLHVAEHINHPAQIQILHKISQYPSTVKYSAINAEPHIMVAYILDLASQFHSLWNIQDIRFITQNKNETNANLALVLAVKNVISSCLHAFGITPLETM